MLTRPQNTKARLSKDKTTVNTFGLKAKDRLCHLLKIHISMQAIIVHTRDLHGNGKLTYPQSPSITAPVVSIPICPIRYGFHPHLSPQHLTSIRIHQRRRLGLGFGGTGSIFFRPPSTKFQREHRERGRRMIVGWEKMAIFSQ